MSLFDYRENSVIIYFADRPKCLLLIFVVVISHFIMPLYDYRAKK